MMSWKPQVRTDDSGKWYDNALRFATKLEAEDYAEDLMWRWTSVNDWRVVECDDAVTHAFFENQVVEIEE